MENGLTWDIGEVDIIKGDLALEPGIGDGTIFGMRMFPSPTAGLFLTFDWVAILIGLSVDQGNVAIVNFAWFVDEVEDTLRTGKSHGNKVNLLRDKANRHHEGFGEREEGDDAADGKSRHMVDDAIAAD